MGSHPVSLLLQQPASFRPSAALRAAAPYFCFTISRTSVGVSLRSLLLLEPRLTVRSSRSNLIFAYANMLRMVYSLKRICQAQFQWRPAALLPRHG